MLQNHGARRTQHSFRLKTNGAVNARSSVCGGCSCFSSRVLLVSPIVRMTPNSRAAHLLAKLLLNGPPLTRSQVHCIILGAGYGRHSTQRSAGLSCCERQSRDADTRWGGTSQRIRVLGSAIDGPAAFRLLRRQQGYNSPLNVFGCGRATLRASAGCRLILVI